MPRWLNQKYKIVKNQSSQNWEVPKNSEILRVKTMVDNLMYIPNDYTQNSLFCRLQLVVETFEHSTK